MNKVKIRIGQHSYFKEVPDPLRPDETIKVIAVANMGDEIEVDDAELERGSKLEAFVGSVPEAEEEAAAFDVATAGVDEIVEYLREKKPTAKETVALAGGDPDIAQRVLDAELALASDEGGDPRKSVVDPLEKIAE